MKTMDNFTFCSPTKIVFGKDSEKTIGKELKGQAQKVLIHYGSERIIKNGLFDTITKSLRDNGIDYTSLGGVVPNPRYSKVLEGIELAKKEHVDYVLAVGGGSVIDSSKAIALGFYYEGNDLYDLWINQVYSKLPCLPVACILTIPAAGSETSNVSVITRDTDNLKIGFSNDVMTSRLSIINPMFFTTLPKKEMANGVCDIIMHILERYFTNTPHNDTTNGMSVGLIKSVMLNARILNEDITNYDAWAEIGLAGTFAHNNLVGIGKKQDWATHKMEHELSAIYDISHGAGLAILFPHWLRYVYRSNISVSLSFSIDIMGVDPSGKTDDEIVLEGIEKIRGFFDMLGLPKTLSDVGIDDKNIRLMAEKATHINFGSPIKLGNFKKLDTEDLIRIYTSAL